jgi:uncharacterized MAPEG superfamily protein
MTMSIELWTLIGAIFLGLLHVSAASMTFKAEVGNAYTVGARDEERRPTRSRRSPRARAPQLQRDLPAVRGAGPCCPRDRLLAASGARAARCIYLGGRALYLPAYASGIPWVRTICWNIATLGLVLALVQLVRFAATT